MNATMISAPDILAAVRSGNHTTTQIAARLGVSPTCRTLAHTLVVMRGCGQLAQQRDGYYLTEVAA